MNSTSPLMKIDLYVKVGSADSKLFDTVYAVYRIPESLKSEKFMLYGKSLYEHNAMHWIWARIWYQNGRSVDQPIAHFIGSFQIPATTYRYLYEASAAADVNDSAADYE